MRLRHLVRLILALALATLTVWATAGPARAALVWQLTTSGNNPITWRMVTPQQIDLVCADGTTTCGGGWSLPSNAITYWQNGIVTCVDQTWIPSVPLTAGWFDENVCSAHGGIWRFDMGGFSDCCHIVDSFTVVLADDGCGDGGGNTMQVGDITVCPTATPTPTPTPSETASPTPEPTSTAGGGGGSSSDTDRIIKAIEDAKNGIIHSIEQFQQRVNRLLIPDPVVMKGLNDRIGSALTSPFQPWADALNNLAGAWSGSSGGCSGPVVPIPWGQNEVYEWRPLDACNEPMRGMAVLVRAAATVLIVTTTLWTGVRSIAAGFGYLD